jgi:hypothetical protein
LKVILLQSEKGKYSGGTVRVAGKAEEKKQKNRKRLPHT